MKEIALPGLDGGNLLGFVAALGVLEALAATRSPGASQPRLGWRHDGKWHPVVTGASSVDELIDRVLEDAKSRAVENVLSFRYVKIEKNGPKEVSSLAAPLAVLRAFLAAHLANGFVKTAEIVGALMCESSVESMKEVNAPTAQDLSGFGIAYDPTVRLDLAVSPTPFDFTSRNTQFLDQLRRIRDVLTLDSVRDELLHGKGSATERIMRWDALVDMPGALFDRVTPVRRPASEWLAFRGLVFFPLFTRSGRVAMAGFSGRRKSGEFNWIVWERPLVREVIKTALSAGWALKTKRQRQACGVPDGFAVSFRKDATGYDGTVSHSRPI